MSNFLIPKSFAISVVRHIDEDGGTHYNALVELNTDEDAVLLATEIFSDELYDCCIEAVATGMRFSSDYGDEILLFACDGEPILDTKVPFTVTDLVDALDDPDMVTGAGDRTLH